MAYQCPSCTERFDSRRGLGVHHSSVHDERLPNRECAECGTDFHCEYERKYCSEECHDTAVSYGGEANPNYRGGKEPTTCEICGDSFEYYPSEKKGLYCAECVENGEWREPPVSDGTDHPQWGGGKVSAECAVCGDRVERYPSQTSGKETLCSNECRYDWLSEEFTGEGHPNWEGGDVGNYGPGWNRVRREALERDGYECVVCRTGREELGRNPDVHHIVPVRLFEHAEGHDRTDAHRLSNVVSLCVDCHRKADFGAIPKARLREECGVEAPDGPPVDAP